LTPLATPEPGTAGARDEAAGEETTTGAPASEDQEALEELPEVTPAPADVQPPVLGGPEGKPLGPFLNEVAADLDQKWAQWFAGAGYGYRTPGLLIYDEYQLSIGGCGGVIYHEQGPLYCSQTETIYWPFPYTLPHSGRQLEAYGDFAVATVLAHEWAHHVQNHLGYVKDWNVTSVQMENQADCFAGVWATTVYYKGRLESGDIEEAVNLLMNIGDLPSTPVDPQTHGTFQERINWFLTGYNTGDPSRCWS
jgi:predicted metalloprotease